MIDTLVQWAGTLWGTTVLVAVAWCSVSFLFCFTLGRIITLLEGVSLREATEPDPANRRGPRRARAETVAPPQGHRQQGA